MSTTTEWRPWTTVSSGFVTITTYASAEVTTITYSEPTTLYRSYTTIPGSSVSSSIYTSSSTTSSTSSISTNSASSTSSTITTFSTSSSLSSSSISKTSPTGAARAVTKDVPIRTVVGVGFGTAFVGAVIAILVVWVLLRRSRRSRRAGENSWLSDGDAMGKLGDPKSNSVGKVISPSIIALDDIALDPADDSQIRKSMQSLYELIYQHVENHYSSRNLQDRRENLGQELAKSGWSDQTDPSIQTIESLLINPVTRRAAIRLIITRMIVQHIDLKSSPEASLLPSHIVTSGQAILKIKRTPGEQEAFSSSFIKWRYLTASLMSPPSSLPNSLEADSSLHAAIECNLRLLNGLLQPFTKSGTDAQLAQSDNLASIILEGARFGILLFSQPALWIFGWDAKTSNNGSANKTLVVFPSIGRIIRRDRRDDLRVVVDAVLERV